MNWIFLIILFLVLAVAYSRHANDDYHSGSGIFKNSEYNLDEKEKDMSDVEYFNRDGKMK